MREEIWKPLKRAQCDGTGEEVALEVRVIYPAEVLPDQPSPILAHRCYLQRPRPPRLLLGRDLARVRSLRVTQIHCLR